MKPETAYREIVLDHSLVGYYHVYGEPYVLRVECDNQGVHIWALADDTDEHPRPDAGPVLDLTHAEALRLANALQETDRMWSAYRSKRASDTSPAAAIEGASGQAQGEG